MRLVTVGGRAATAEAEHALLDAVLARVGTARPRVCFLPTASGDDPASIARFQAAFEPLDVRTTTLLLFRRTVADLDAFLQDQHLVWVGGGSTPNLAAVWEAHGLPDALRRAAEAGVVLGGVSAGAACWAEGTVTDGFGDLRPWRGGLGWLQGSLCPHWDAAPARRAAFLDAVRTGALPPGHALDDGTAAWWEGGVPTRVWGAGRLWRVGADGGCVDGSAPA